MKELELLNEVFDYITGDSKQYNSVQITDKLIDIKLALYRLEKLDTPPMREYVCEKLSEYYKQPVLYSNERYNHMFYFEISKNILFRLVNGGITFTENDYQRTNNLPPHLIELIGRFYSSLEIIDKLKGERE